MHPKPPLKHNGFVGPYLSLSLKFNFPGLLFLCITDRNKLRLLLVFIIWIATKIFENLIFLNIRPFKSRGVTTLLQIEHAEDGLCRTTHFGTSPQIVRNLKKNYNSNKICFVIGRLKNWIICICSSANPYR